MTASISLSTTKTSNIRRHGIWLSLALLILVGCASAPPRHPVPVAELTEAAIPQIPGIPDARYWGDVPPDNLNQLIQEVADQRRSSGINEATVLALLGGADDGAYGAGLLNAWTDLGDRPEFSLVTGVSTGALSAPFAFLGSDYDHALRQVYGEFPPNRIFTLRHWLDILPLASVADSQPLAGLIAQYADEAFLAKVAAEHKRGRRLFVQTSHIDAQRPVIWDMGAIASSNAPNAADVFHKALLASASVPGVFPPVQFTVEVDGKAYDELHVDGGVISENTVLADWQPTIHDQLEADLADGRDMPLTIYVVRNGRVSPQPEPIEHSLPAIAGRSISTLIKQQGIGDLARAYDVAQLRGADFNVTWIGDDFQADYPGPFDPEYMKALFKYGFDRMHAGKAWSASPP